MELRSIRYFAAVADRLSFSHASAQLNVSQPAISRQIQQLEAELNVRLFDRIGRRIVLTPAGEDLLVRCYAILKDVESLSARAAELAGGKKGILRVGATPQTLESLIAAVLPIYQRKHPNVDIALVEDGSASLLQQVDQGLVHVAVGALGHEQELKGRPLFPLGVLALVQKGHPFSGREWLDVTELADQPMLLLRREFMTRQLFDGACQVAQMRPRMLIESGSPHCLMSLVSSGIGIAVIPSTVALENTPHVPVPLRQAGRQLGFWMHAIWNPRRYVPPATEGFIEALCDYTRHSYPGQAFAFGDLVQGATTPVLENPD